MAIEELIKRMEEKFGVKIDDEKVDGLKEELSKTDTHPRNVDLSKVENVGVKLAPSYDDSVLLHKVSRNDTTQENSEDVMGDD